MVLTLRGNEMNRYILATLMLFALVSNSFGKDLPLNIKKGMSYTKARSVLLNNGWQTVVAHTAANGTPVCFKVADILPTNKEYNQLVATPACKYEEIDACSGTGMGFCKMSFFDGDHTYLDVQTSEGEPPAAYIYSWRKYKETVNDSRLKTSQSGDSHGEVITRHQAEAIFMAEARGSNRSVSEVAIAKCAMQTTISEAFKGKSSLTIDEYKQKIDVVNTRVKNQDSEILVPVLKCVLKSGSITPEDKVIYENRIVELEGGIVDIDSLKVDAGSLVGKRVQVTAVGNYVMNTFMIKKTPTDTSPILVDISKLKHEDKLRIVQRCSDIIEGCSIKIFGTVGKVNYQSGVIASRIDW